MDNQKIKKESKTYLLYSAIPFCLFIIMYVFLFYYLHTHLAFILDSDDASELILSKLLSDKNQILTNEWFYSSELRVLNTQIIYSLVFHFITNWHWVRIISLFIMTIILLLSCYYFLSKMGLTKYFIIAALIFVIPFSNDYFLYVLKGGYYFPHIIISLFAIGLIEDLLDNSRNKIILFALVLLAFLSGLGGPRQVIVTYIPAFIASIIRCLEDLLGKYDCVSIQRDYYINPKCLKYFKLTLCAFSFALLGYFVNAKILGNIYFFQYHKVRFKEISFERIEAVLNGFFLAAGYSEGEVLSYNLLTNIIAFLAIAISGISLVYGLKSKGKVSDRYHRYSLLTASAYIFFVLLYFFSDLPFVSRYNLPIIVFSIPLFFFYIDEKIKKVDKKQIILSVLFIMILIQAVGRYKEFDEIDNNSELREIVGILEKNGYLEGYATFWNANILTEFSNGLIEVWDWGNFPDDVDCVDRMYEWLQLTNHVSEHPKGKVFIILSETQNDSEIAKRIPEDNFIYCTADDINWNNYDEDKQVTRYFVYGFDSYEEMYNIVGIYHDSTKEDLRVGGIKSTDRRMLYPGSYSLVIEGENIDNSLVEFEYYPYMDCEKTVSKRPFYLKPEKIICESGKMFYDFEINDIANGFRAIIKNTEEKRVSITDIKIVRRFD